MDNPTNLHRTNPFAESSKLMPRIRGVFRVQGLGFWGVSFRIQGIGLTEGSRAQGIEGRGSCCSGLALQELGSGVEGLGFRV